MPAAPRCVGPRPVTRPGPRAEGRGLRTEAGPRLPGRPGMGGALGAAGTRIVLPLGRPPWPVLGPGPRRVLGRAPSPPELGPAEDMPARPTACCRTSPRRTGRRPGRGDVQPPQALNPQCVAPPRTSEGETMQHVLSLLSVLCHQVGEASRCDLRPDLFSEAAISRPTRGGGASLPLSTGIQVENRSFCPRAFSSLLRVRPSACEPCLCLSRAGPSKRGVQVPLSPGGHRRGWPRRPGVAGRVLARVRRLPGRIFIALSARGRAGARCGWSRLCRWSCDLCTMRRCGSRTTSSISSLCSSFILCFGGECHAKLVMLLT